VARNFLSGLVHELFPAPQVTVTGSHYVDVTLNHKNDALLVNPVNTAGPHQDRSVNVFDDIPAVGPLQVNIACPQPPKSVRLQPRDRNVPFVYSNNPCLWLSNVWKFIIS